MSALTKRQLLENLYAVNPQEIDGIPWEPVNGFDGVHQKIIWQLGGFTQALIRFQPGAATVGEPHLAAHHHIWVVSGAATIAGRRLTAGSYVHVPPGVLHPVKDIGPDGCTLLQTHRPHAMVEAEALVSEERRADLS
jgi:glyoxylate utilization-related uncharacterized protein